MAMTDAKMDAKKISPPPVVSCPLCRSENTRLIARLEKKPEKETDFGIKDYRRSIFFCESCKVYFNRHGHDLSGLYSGNYNKATYDNRIVERYEKIMALPEDKSDNNRRVVRLVHFLRDEGMALDEAKVLDIGSGLCVFLAELKKSGPKTYCLDPDMLSVKHARENVKVDGAWQGSIEEFDTNERFDLITFNKVLEHVTDPVAMLAKSRKFLSKKGVVYIELPDASGAEKTDDFSGREEFFIEHNFIFTRESARFMIDKAGFKVLALDHILEPSGKYTIFAFMRSRS